MKKFIMVTPETLNRLGLCFANSEEVQQFIVQMDSLGKEITFSNHLRDKLPESVGGIVLLKQVAIFTLFCREHMELVQQLVKNCITKEITEEEVNEFMQWE